MIVIFSRSDDYTTMQVMRWIKQLNKEIELIRINSDANTGPHGVSLDGDRFVLCFDDYNFDLATISHVWYRKGTEYLDLSIEPGIENNEPLTSELNRLSRDDAKRVRECIHDLIQRKCSVLGCYGRGNLNKLIILAMAREVGLNTPDFLVSNQKSDFLKYIKSEDQCITKAISDGLYLFDDDVNMNGYFNYTSKVSRNNFSDYEDDFVPLSLVQEMIEKKYEVRTLFLEDSFHSVAIFSQRDRQTQVDYRRYNSEKPNRVVPFCLPSEIKVKLIELFDNLSLNTGSVDLIVDTDGNYIFLEINPVGQFGPYSIGCNYNLEKRIAEVLLNEG